MKKITVWSRVIQKKGQEPTNIHNHIQDGWVYDMKPKPLKSSFTDQNCWTSFNWSKEFKFLKDTKIV